MSVITRREFFQKTGTGAAVAGFLAGGGLKLHANPLGLPIGSQTYPHRQRIVDNDFAGLLKDMKALASRSSSCATRRITSTRTSLTESRPERSSTTMG